MEWRISKGAYNYKWNRKSALKEAVLSSADQNIMLLLWVQRRASQL